MWNVEGQTEQWGSDVIAQMGLRTNRNALHEFLKGHKGGKVARSPKAFHTFNYGKVETISTKRLTA